MTANLSPQWGDVGLLSLLRSPFLLPSVLLHALIFFLAVRAVSLTLSHPPPPVPISVQLLEGGRGSSDKSIGQGRGPGGPRALPKLGTPVAPRQRTGKLDRGSLETSTPAASPEPEAPSKPAPLPGPKVLAADLPRQPVNASETSADSLVRLPTRESPARLPASAGTDAELHARNPGANTAGDAAGIKALKEGAQIPGALKGSGAGTGPYGVPGGIRSGTGIAGGGTGTGTGGGSATGLKGTAAADFNQYLNQLKKRVQAVWRYPDGVSGIQKVAVVFTLDRAGKLLRAEVLESSDARLNASAVDAMRRASPFPPMPESLKELANEPLRMQFTVTIAVRG
jgi:TonB family protein